MSNAWGISWGVAWGSSWGGSTPAPVDTSTEIYAGWPADWKRRDSKHWTDESELSTRFELEIEALEAEESSKLLAVREAKAHIELERLQEVEQSENIAAYESLARQETEKREQFLIYEQKMLREINELRIRRVRLIRLRQEEEVVLSILLDLPPLH